jgi:aspartate aminotransferase
MLDAYVGRREWLVPALDAIPGFECAPPDGAFYVFPRVNALYSYRDDVHDSASLAQYFLEEARVAVVPGAAFGADDHIRISYATSMEALREGVRRLTAAVEKLMR